MNRERAMPIVVDDKLYIEHHGVKGMKWGIRRYQNPDGSLTAKGKQQQQTNDAKVKARRKALGKKVAIGAAVTVGVVLAAYGGVSAYQAMKDTKAVRDAHSQARFRAKIEEGLRSNAGGEIFEPKHRFTRHSKTENFMARGRAFVTKDSSRNDFYMNMTNAEHKLSAHNRTPIRSATTRDQVKILRDKLSGTQTFSSEQLKRPEGKGLGKRMAQSIFDKNIAKVKLSDITQSEWTSQATKPFIDELKKSGYGAAFDVWDQGPARILFDEKRLNIHPPQKFR